MCTWIAVLENKSVKVGQHCARKCQDVVHAIDGTSFCRSESPQFSRLKIWTLPRNSAGGGDAPRALSNSCLFALGKRVTFLFIVLPTAAARSLWFRKRGKDRKGFDHHYIISGTRDFRIRQDSFSQPNAAAGEGFRKYHFQVDLTLTAASPPTSSAAASPTPAPVS